MTNVCFHIQPACGPLQALQPSSASEHCLFRLYLLCPHHLWAQHSAAHALDHGQGQRTHLQFCESPTYRWLALCMQRDIALTSAWDLSHVRTTNEHNGSDPLWRTTQLFDPKFRHTDRNLPLAELSGVGVITSPTGVWYYSKEIVDGVFHWKSTSSQKIAPAVVTLIHNIAHKLV